MRIRSIDILRGIAVLQMVFWQIYDFFSTTDIYSYYCPLFVKAFNMPINGIGLAIFALISGTSLYLSFSEKKKKMSSSAIIKHSIKRYGSYILVSLFFTSFVFGFSVFYRWGEAIQGIGFAALVATLLLLTIRKPWFYLSSGILLIFIQQSLRKAIETPYIIQRFPIEHVLLNFSGTVSIMLNATIRGFFALTHVLPFMILGIFLGMIVKQNKKQLFIGAIFVSAALLMHHFGMKIDIYNVSPAYLLGFSGFTFMLFGIIDFLMKLIGKNPIFSFIQTFGMAPLVAYLLHFLVIYKPMELLGIESTFNTTISYISAIICVLILYQISRLWISRKKIIDHFKKLSSSSGQ